MLVCSDGRAINAFPPCSAVRVVKRRKKGAVNNNAIVGNKIHIDRQSNIELKATTLAGPSDSLIVWPSWAIEMARPRATTYLQVIIP